MDSPGNLIKAMEIHIYTKWRVKFQVQNLLEVPSLISGLKLIRKTQAYSPYSLFIITVLSGGRGVE